MKPCDINIKDARVFIHQMERVLNPVRRINPLLPHIKLDKKKADDFRELLEVL
jgi:hypothetical protein